MNSCFGERNEMSFWALRSDRQNAGLSTAPPPASLSSGRRAARWITRVRREEYKALRVCLSPPRALKRTFRSAFCDTDHRWQVTVSEGGTCTRGLRISRPKCSDVYGFSFESAGVLALDNEYSGFAVLPAHYIAFAERKNACLQCAIYNLGGAT